MEARSKYIIEKKRDSENCITVDDCNPEGVTIHVIEGPKMASYNAPRLQMIAALEYVLAKLKTTVKEPASQ
jgi:hypothetical protein